MEVPSLKGELRELIERHLERHHAGESAEDGTRAENETALDEVDLSGKRVLDLGSSLGELSRGARARGAALVDGFERDPLLVELAAAIDASEQVSRVSYQANDIRDPAVYRDHYDVVLAFSVFPHVEPVLEQLAGITDELLVLDAREGEGDFEGHHVRLVGRHFPHYAILGEPGVTAPATGARSRSSRRTSPPSWMR